MSNQIKKLPREREDEIASEPDMVQDRGQDFDEFLRQYQASAKTNGNVAEKVIAIVPLILLV